VTLSRRPPPRGMHVPSTDDPSEVVRVDAPRRSASFMRLKRCVQVVFTVCALPRLLMYYLAHTFVGRRAFAAASESIACVPGLRGVYLRQAFYGRTLVQCGRDVYFGWQSAFSMSDVRIGERAYIGRFCSIGFASIGDEAMLADHVQILSGGHEHTRGNPAQSMHGQGQCFHRVRVGKGVWIGAGAIVMADVGEHAIVGAGAVVTRPIPAYSVAVGVPARVVKTLPHLHAAPIESAVAEECCTFGRELT
jgi:acetyltransferase-like isoleucine patch superfamily enzyme